VFSTDNLADQAHRVLRSLHAPLLSAFLKDWPTGSAQRNIKPQTLPVLRWLPQVCQVAPPFSSPFVDALAEAAPLLAWRRSYTLEEVGAEFLDNYGWTELMGLEGPNPSRNLACGVLLLGPHVTYPPHAHEAEEIYVPLAGTAAWKRGSESWDDRAPGTVIHHAPHEPHAMQTASSALLALYLWRSKNLAQKSRIEPAS
jgi:quercetin dioxygenase-like cupin family protein